MGSLDLDIPLPPLYYLIYIQKELYQISYCVILCLFTVLLVQKFLILILLFNVYITFMVGF